MRSSASIAFRTGFAAALSRACSIVTLKPYFSISASRSFFMVSWKASVSQLARSLPDTTSSETWYSFPSSVT